MGTREWRLPRTKSWKWGNDNKEVTYFSVIFIFMKTVMLSLPIVFCFCYNSETKEYKCAKWKKKKSVQGDLKKINRPHWFNRTNGIMLTAITRDYGVLCWTTSGPTIKRNANCETQAFLLVRTYLLYFFQLFLIVPHKNNTNIE